MAAHNKVRPPAVTANFAWAFSKAGIAAPPLFDAMADLVRRATLFSSHGPLLRPA